MATMEDESMRDLDPEGAIGEDDVDNAAHEKLLNSIYALDGKKRSHNQVRGAGIPSNNVELLVHTKTESTKIKPTDLNLKKKHGALVAKPLSSLQMEKAKRHIAREDMEKDTKKWEPIVKEIRMASQTKYAERPKGMEMYKAMQPQKFSPRTPLEIELYEALGKSEDIIKPDQPLTDAEVKALKAMSVKEAMERRKELLMHHELLTRMQVKAKRIKKIKSKRFRRGKRKEREAEEKKKVEMLRQTDPEAFLEKMDEVDKARMEERLTLKHKQGGKFARYHKAYSKYDNTTRDAIQEMIRKGKELTQKRHLESSDEEEEEVVPVPTLIPVALTEDGEDNDGRKGSDVKMSHLEIMKTISRKAGGWLDSSTKYVYQEEGKEEEEKEMQSASSDSEDEEKEPEEAVIDVDHRKTDEKSCDNGEDNVKTSLKRKRKETSDGVELAEVEKEMDEDVSLREKSPLKKKTKVSQQSTPPQISQDSNEFKKKKKKDKVQDIILQPVEGMESDKKDDSEDEGEVAVTMEELFEDEDVVEQFARDKAEEDEKRKPKKEIVKLPGWGSWSGPDFKHKVEKKTKRRRKFMARTKPTDTTQPTVWLNPNRDEAIRELQPKRIPFPFVDSEQYAAAIRQPVSRGFVRETVHKILVKPEVVTKQGQIINPLDKDDFFKKKETLEEDENSNSIGNGIKYTGPINFREKDSRLKTKTTESNKSEISSNKSEIRSETNKKKNIKAKR